MSPENLATNCRQQEKNKEPNGRKSHGLPSDNDINRTPESSNVGEINPEKKGAYVTDRERQKWQNAAKTNEKRLSRKLIKRRTTVETTKALKKNVSRAEYGMEVMVRM